MSANEFSSDADPGDAAEVDRLRGEVETLRSENKRLRAEYIRAKQSQYRRSATTLAVVGILSLLAGIIVANARTVLLALGGTATFLAILIYFLTPERYLSASVSEAIYSSLARNEGQLVNELGLEDEQIYIPVNETNMEVSSEPIKLFIPQRTDYEIPSPDELNHLFVVSENERTRGVSLQPSALELYTDFERATREGSITEPAEAAVQVSDALVEQFEIVESVQVEENTGRNSIATRLSGSSIGDLRRFDHPAVSLLAIAVAHTSDQPVKVDIEEVDEQGNEFVVTCSEVADDNK